MAGRLIDLQMIVISLVETGYHRNHKLNEAYLVLLNICKDIKYAKEMPQEEEEKATALFIDRVTKEVIPKIINLIGVKSIFSSTVKCDLAEDVLWNLNMWFASASQASRLSADYFREIDSTQQEMKLQVAALEDVSSLSVKPYNGSSVVPPNGQIWQNMSSATNKAMFVIQPAPIDRPKTGVVVTAKPGFFNSGVSASSSSNSQSLPMQALTKTLNAIKMISPQEIAFMQYICQQMENKSVVDDVKLVLRLIQTSLLVNALSINPENPIEIISKQLRVDLQDLMVPHLAKQQECFFGHKFNSDVKSRQNDNQSVRKKLVDIIGDPAKAQLLLQMGIDIKAPAINVLRTQVEEDSKIATASLQEVKQ